MPLQIVKLLDPIQITVSGTFTPKGAYDNGTDYAVGDQVDYNGTSYIMYSDASAGTLPTDDTKWGVLAEKGDQGDPTTVNGKTGTTITLDPDDLDDTSTTNKFATASELSDIASNTSARHTHSNKALLDTYTQTEANLADAVAKKHTAVDISGKQDILSEGAFVDGDKTKLDGIEALADVTDTANVTSAGALMDSEVTNLADVKSFDPTDYAPALGTDDNYVTDAEKVVIGNTSGTNTGDQDLSGYELLSNKDTTTTLGTSDTLYPSQKAVKTYVDTTAGAYVPLAGGTMTGTLTGRQVAPSADSTYTLGTSTNYYSNTYTDRLYLNSTAYLNGSTAGQINPTGSFGSTSLYNGASLTLYNTTDQTTNYEHLKIDWSSNLARIFTFNGGTGTRRALFIGSGPSLGITVNNGGGATASVPKLLVDGGTTSASYPISQVATLTSGSSVQYVSNITPTITQSGTAGYTALLINPTETSTGSGAKNLIDAQVGGTSKFKVANTGDAEITTSSAGVILKDSSGGRWRVTVDTSGALTTTSI